MQNTPSHLGVFFDKLFLPDSLIFCHQVVRRLGSAVVFDDTINRTHLIAGRFIIKAHALSAQVGIDDVGFLPFLVVADRIVRAFRLADVAVDTIGGDF